LGFAVNDFEMRPMTRADLAEVLEVERAGFSHPWTEAMLLAELDNPQASIDLLWQDESLAAYLCSWFVCGELHILNVVTAPEFRRRGLARRLLDHVD
jgi:[ribosomal protein S18]-alanine N-acetyltransferase